MMRPPGRFAYMKEKGDNGKMKKYVLSLDQGTTSTRALLIDRSGRACYKASRELECLYPRPGEVELDAERIWVSTVDVINEVLILSGASWDDIDSIGITNQRETTIIYEKKTGRPIHNAIVWQSKASAEICERYRPYEKEIRAKTGLLINPYFSASKIRYVLEKVPGAKERARRGELAFGTVDSFLVYKMTKGKTFATDATNASRTMLYNIESLSYDRELLKLFDIDPSLLPEVRSSDDDYGEASFFDCRVHIHGILGDQQSALFGQGCLGEGESKNTYGTGCFMLMNTGSRPVYSKKGLLTTVAALRRGKASYALEGSVLVGGAVVQWLRDEMNWFKRSSDVEEYAMRRPDTGGVYVVPAFVGLGTPYWDDEARGAIFGLTRGSDRHNITRAALYSIAYQSKDVIELMKEEAGLDLPTLKVDGGASSDALLMQFQADILRSEILVPEQIETTALGAGYLSGLATGFYESEEALFSKRSYARRYTPLIDKEEADRLYEGWKEAVKATRAYKPR